MAGTQCWVSPQQQWIGIHHRSKTGTTCAPYLLAKLAMSVIVPAAASHRIPLPLFATHCRCLPPCAVPCRR